MVVETMMREKLSYRETAVQFGIGNHSHVANWERIYLMEGSEGLYIERRGPSNEVSQRGRRGFAERTTAASGRKCVPEKIASPGFG